MKTIQHQTDVLRKTALATLVAVCGVCLPSQLHAAVIYDLVADFANLNIPALASPTTMTQPSGVWSYQYENAPHNHDGTYTPFTLGWNANYRGYGMASMNSNSYMGGANVRAVVNATDNPNGVPVPNPASANYLYSFATVGAGFQWEPLVIVWTAPSDGSVTANITIQNMSAPGPNATTDLSLDFWNGSSLTFLDTSELAGGTSDTLTATQSVLAGQQIQIWRDAYVDQQGTIVFSGTLEFTAIPEPSTWTLLAISLTSVMVLRRRRSRA